jgi:tripartite-type tricarboxylate transporter receptor subunit TctC
MDKTRRSLLLGSLIACGMPATLVRAQERWPSRPINYIVPFAAGGSTDIVGRILAAKLGPAIGTSVVVQNRAGAAGNIGSAAVARSAPDGYTIGGASIASHAINVSLYAQMPYDPLKDFTPISLVGSLPNLLIVNAATPFRSVKDIVAAAKAKPGSISFASAGGGTSQHLSAELFKLVAGIDMVHVPYKGAGPAMQSVVAGETPLSFENSIVAAPHIQSGRVRALAITSAERKSSFPDVPTMIESGFPDYEVTSWQAVFGPAGLPPAIAQRLYKEIAEILRQPDVISNFEKLGLEALGWSPERLTAFQTAEIAKWAKVIKAANLKQE